MSASWIIFTQIWLQTSMASINDNILDTRIFWEDFLYIPNNTRESPVNLWINVAPKPEWPASYDIILNPEKSEFSRNISLRFPTIHTQPCKFVSQCDLSGQPHTTTFCTTKNLLHSQQSQTTIWPPTNRLYNENEGRFSSSASVIIYLIHLGF